ncbi:hypothetical protein FDZ14_30240 (plasmid) [Priestia megaterium]|uniref:Uncharacterized protein n=2 Tax=Priestia megaterium TaxID=1404 RepID=A0A6M6E5G1_PRIMG|nr:hypothetical protein FDZ14_30240 [Priestia megaterium]
MQGSISIIYFIINTLLIVNFFTEVVDGGNLFGELEGMPILAPAFLAPIAVVPSIFGYTTKKDKLCLWGIILCSILFLFPFAYMILGTLIFGP